MTSGSADDVYVKASTVAPPGYCRWEAAGLRWLGEAPNGAHVVPVIGVDDTSLRLKRLVHRSASQDAAEDFGRRLACTHAAGAPAFGTAPAGWQGDGFLGPFSEPLPLMLRPSGSWGRFWAHQRIAPMLAEARRRRVYSPSDVAVFEKLAQRLADGEFDDGEPASRLHGDLWSGNVMWTAHGATLIDPAAHGGHRETDLAMLALFGAPYLSSILAAYNEASPLTAGWRDRVSLHQVHPLMVHAVLFGGGYVRQSVAAAARYN